MNQSLYVGYKVMLAGLLMISKGDRISMHSSVETRYPFLDDDVIQFCSEIAPEYKLRGRTEKWILRQVAARTLPAADRQPAQDDVPIQVLGHFPRRPAIRSGSTNSSPSNPSASHRLFRRRDRSAGADEAALALPRWSPPGGS